MSDSVMLGRDLDILPPDIAARVFILDSDIREMDLIVEVGQVVLARPFLNLLDRSIRPAIAVPIATISFLKKALIVAL